METERMKEVRRPSGRLSSAKMTTVAFQEQACQSPVHVVIDEPKLVGGIARAEVGPPPTEHRVELRDGHAQVPMTRGAGRERLHALLHPMHGALRWPSLEEVHPLVSLLPERSAHALTQVTAEKVEPLAPAREVDLSRFVRVVPARVARRWLARVARPARTPPSCRT